MRVAFIVMAYNRPDALLAVLRGLAPQVEPGDLVIVADDGSRDDAVRALRDGCPAFEAPVFHVWHPDKGFTLARSRNLGAALAHQEGADYVVFLDGDCVPSPHFVRSHRALARPGHFVTGSRVLLDPTTSAAACAGHLNLLAIPAWRWLGLRLGGRVNKVTHLVNLPFLPGRVRDSFDWRSIRGCNMGFWMQDYVAVNGSDESFSGWGHEDADLVLRMHNLGRRRLKGHMSTEVFHLWHPENSRDQEESNRLRVQERQQCALQRALVGLDEARAASDVVQVRLSSGATSHKGFHS